ncbi:MAG: BamA/TamA family outer membrane protein [Saprospiraceae bacterium]|nr:BamA/TamA family outer membrane protein [Saprospiraceae bacterium]
MRLQKGMCRYIPAFFMVAKAKIKYLFWSALVFLWSLQTLLAQNELLVLAHITQENQQQQVQEWNKMDSVALVRYAEKQVSDWKRKAYLLANLDSIVKDSAAYRIYLHKGKAFKHIDFRSDPNTLPNIVFTSDPMLWQSWAEEKIREDANHGFPFSRIELIHPEIKGDSLIAQIEYVQGPPILFGPIEQRKNKLLNRKYLERLMAYKMGRPYNESIIREFEQDISRLSFVSSEYPPLVHFLGDQALLWVYLVKKPANRVEALLGLNSTGLGASREYRITGEANIDLWNSFKIGERLHIRYENLQENSPRLTLLTDFPYLPYIPLGWRMQFDLIKFKEDYISQFFRTGIKQRIGKYQELVLEFQYNRSYLLNVDTLYIRNNQKLPQSLDFNFVSYGISYNLNQLNNLLSPTKGMLLQTSFLFGNKNFEKNSKILQYDTPEQLLSLQYDSINASKLQMNAEFKIGFYQSLSKRQVLKIAQQSFYIYTEGKILANELYRMGGFKNLRGFDDDFFLSSAYFLNTLEYRFLLDKFSFLYLFLDYSRMQVISQNQILPWANYWGMGTGIQLKTGAGIFTLAFAVGKRPEDGFDWSGAKVHFGYVNLF